jgi:hypothetical protein
LKWKIQYADKSVEYYNPNDVQLILRGCQLKNHKSVAQKIFNGNEKSVCAWVLCDEVEILKDNFTQLDTSFDKLKYNPRVEPNWVLNGVNADNEKFGVIGSVDYGLYVINK